MRPRLLDLFCGAGGAAMGYHRAGFDVVGVDNRPQPHYPFAFVQADALGFVEQLLFDTRDDYTLSDFDVIHASPPCQRHSAMSNCRPGLADSYPDLIAPTRALLEESGLPWVIENVPGAPLRPDLVLCGRMFQLPLYRHRLFESSVVTRLVQPEHARHTIPASRAGHWKPGTIISVSGNCAPIAVARKAMGIDWTNRDELGEAIPPAYTEYIELQLIEQLAVAEAAA